MHTPANIPITAVANTLTTKYAETVLKVRQRTFGLSTDALYTEPWRHRRLVHNIMIARTVDTNALQSCIEMFGIYHTLPNLCKADSQTLINIMEAHNVQWPGKKAQQIIATAHKVCNEFSGHVPDTRDALETLPGIGHHAASVTLALMFNQNAFGVDTHVSRIMQRLGFADSEDSNLAIEKYVMSHIPAHMLGDFSRSFVDFGKTICSFQPKCAKCFLKECCVFAAVQPATKIKDVRSNQLKDGTYQVPSSAPGKFYTITVTDGHAQCTCTGFRFRQTCKHIEGAHKWSK